MAVAPSDRTLVYAGSGTGRIFRSSDSGSSWKLASGGIAARSPYLIFSASVDAHDPLTAYAAADVVFKTTDGGVHWAVLPDLPINESNADDVVADPKTSRVVYAATDSGLFKSVDAGVTWTPLNNGLPTGVARVAVSASNPLIVYASLSSGSLYRSDDGGGHWAKTSLANGFGLALAIDPRNPDAVFADNQRSRDGGKSWTANDPRAFVLGFSEDGSIAYGNNLGNILYESIDGGTSWRVLAIGPPDETIESLASAGSSLLAGFQHAGAFRSLDGGRSWRTSNAGLSAVPITSFAASQSNSDRLWLSTGLATGIGRTFNERWTETSPDGGTHWLKTDNFVDAIATDANEPSTAYGPALRESRPGIPYSTVTAFQKTSDAGKSWNDVSIFGCSTTVQLIGDPMASGVVYWLAYDCFEPIEGSALLKIVDGSESSLKLAIETGAFAIDPTMTARLYRADEVNAGAMYRSDDGGQTWTAIAPINDPALSQIVVGNDEKATVLVAGTMGVWRSADRGESWVLTDGVPAPSAGSIALAADLTSPGSFLASANGRFFRSADAGQTWRPFTSTGFPDEPVLQLISSKNRVIFARTTAGIFALLQVTVVPASSASSNVITKHP